MNIKPKIAVLLLGATLAVSCTKSLDTNEQGSSELDWSQTSTITLNEVAMASSTRAGDPLMAIDQTFRLYAIDPKTKDIIATRTYTIKDALGKPVVDDPQNAVIELPFGVVDIFLVGPVKATLNTVEYEIAGPMTVTPMRGVDLISSRTRVTITNKETPIVPEPLQHRMVKLELEVSMVEDSGGDLATYQDALMTDPKHFIGIDNMGGMGTFTFDDQGGSVTAAPVANYQYTYATDNAGTGKIVLTTPGKVVGDVANGYTGAVYTVTDYMTPTSDTTPKLSVTYGYTRRDADKKTEIAAHMMSGKTTAPQAWRGGTYVKIRTTLIPSIDMTLRPQILLWDDGGTTPVEPPVNNDLLFWYSGEDEPERINGKLCWRDRSGNGNHAVIEGSMIYDKVNKCYYATAGGAYFRVPALGKVAEYTLELIAQSVENAQNTAASFSGATGLYIHLPYINQIVWYNRNPQKQVLYSYGNTDKYIFEQLNSYAFSRSSSNEAIIINGAMKVTNANTDPWDDFNDNMLWSVADAAGKQRLYGAKLYKKYMNDATGINTLAANHAAKLSQLGVNAPLIGTTFDYVKDGLIVDLRSETAPSGTPRVWLDQSGRGNSPTLDANVNRFSDDKGIYYGGAAAGDMIRFTKSLGTYKELTIEVVTDVKAGTLSNPLIQFSPNSNGHLRSGIYCTYPNRGYIFEAPYVSDEIQRVSIKAENLKYGPSGLAQLSCSRRGNKLYASQNGYVYNDFVGNVPSDQVNELVNGLIYTNYQHIYAVRIYNRALSDMERQHNYLIDKNKYKILP